MLFLVLLSGNNVACLELLLEMGGVDVQQGNDEGHPMVEAAANGHLEALKVCEHTDDLARHLLLSARLSEKAACCPM